MGRVKVSRRRTSKNKQFKKQHDTKRRRRDIDQIQDDIEKVQETAVAPTFGDGDDLPGLGQHYCICCARHFHDAVTLDVHSKTKDHKRRLKDVAQKKYSQAEADWASGKTKQILAPVTKGKVGV
jgi:bud site selection protein 20